MYITLFSKVSLILITIEKHGEHIDSGGFRGG